MKIELRQAADMLSAADHILILMHHFPDGDTVGSAYALGRALQQHGKHVQMGCSHAIPARYGYITETVRSETFTPSLIVAVDVADAPLLGETYKDIVPDLVIDHHGSNTLYGRRTYVDSNAAANCEIIYRLIHLLNLPIDRQIAAALYTGISTDTGCFKFTNTTPETHRIAAELMAMDIDFGTINRIMFDTKTKSRVLLERLALDHMQFFCGDRCAMITVTTQMCRQTGATSDDLEGITALPRQIEGVVIGITIRQREPELFKISVRTHEPVSASEFCAAFGGGGHIRAAGCEISGSLERVTGLLAGRAAEYLGK